MISVIIPVFNREETIRDCIESVLRQTYTDLEVIVVDDGSTDGTAEKVHSITDERVRYVYQQNKGACAARNHGIDLAKGEFIAFQDSDDRWCSVKMEKQMHVLEEQNADIICCRLCRVKPDGSRELLPRRFLEGYRSRTDNLFGIGTQTLLARRIVFEKYKFDSEMPRFQEFELLYRITSEYPLYCMDEALVEYRIGEDSISRSVDKLLAACDLLEKKHPELFCSAPEMRSVIAWCLEGEGRLACQRNDGRYRECIRRSAVYHGGLRGVVLRLLLITGLYPWSLKMRSLLRGREA